MLGTHWALMVLRACSILVVATASMAMCSSLNQHHAAWPSSLPSSSPLSPVVVVVVTFSLRSCCLSTCTRCLACLCCCASTTATMGASWSDCPTPRWPPLPPSTCAECLATRCPRHLCRWSRPSGPQTRCPAEPTGIPKRMYRTCARHVNQLHALLVECCKVSVLSMGCIPTNTCAAQVAACGRLVAFPAVCLSTHTPQLCASRLPPDGL